MGRTESRRAVRALFLDALEQCQRHMDACPQGREELGLIARHIHTVEEELELRFAWADRSNLEHDTLIQHATAHTMEWQRRMQEIRQRYPLGSTLELLPNWPTPAKASTGSTPAGRVS